MNTELILYNPPSSPNRKPVLPMSLLALAAVAEGRLSYEIVDGNLVDDPVQAIAAKLEKGPTKVLAITVMPGPQLTHAVPACKELKARFPEITVIWGGYFPTMHPTICLQDGCVDFLFRGHSELQFVAFVESLLNGDPDYTTPGLGWFDKDADESKLNPKPSLPDMNQLPAFPYQRVDMQAYVRDTFLGSRTLSHHTSYGCPFLCNFCGVVNMVGGGYAPQSAERTAATIEHLVDRYGANAIELQDNNFFVQEARIVEICKRIAPLNIGWWAYGRVDTLLKYSRDTWQWMRDSGLKMVFMGAETGSEAMLAQMNKGGLITPDKTLQVAQRMRQFGIVPEMSFVLGNPPDPRRDIENTLSFVREVKKVNPITEIILYLYSPVPLAGELFNEAVASGFDFPETLQEWVDVDWEEFAQHRTSELPWLTPADKARVKNFERVLHAKYPTTTDPRLRGVKRSLLKALGTWRYAAEFYDYPLELAAFNRLFPYQRPEVTGF